MTIARAALLSLMALCAPGCTRFDLLNSLIPSHGYQEFKSLSYGPLPRQKLDVYRPKNAGPNVPVVVFFYGGSWQSGQRGDYRFVAQALTHEGFLAILPDYRLYPTASFPGFLDDCAAAVAWAHNHAAEYGGDPRRLFIMGHSAGAYNAVMVGVDPRYLARHHLDRSAVCGIISLSGPFDILPLNDPEYRAVFGPPANDPLVEPFPYLDPGDPPLLLLHGLEDDVVYAEESEQLAFVARDRGIPVRLIEYPHLGHAEMVLSLAHGFRWLGPALHDIAVFIRSTAYRPAATSD